MTTGNAVATQDPKGTAVATFDYGEDAGVGFENVRAGDFKPSFVRVLQANSPQCVDQIPGCTPGKLWDNISGETFKDILFVTAVRQHVYVAWKPRTEGGGGGQGFGGVFEPESETVVEGLKKFNSEHESKFEKGEDGKVILPKTPDGEFDLVETDYYHGVQFIEDSGAIYPVTLPFSSTALPTSGKWFTTMGRQFIPQVNKPRPLFAHLFRIGSAKVEKNGNKWYVPTTIWAKETAAASLLDPKGDLYQAARAVAIAFKEGRTKVDYAQGGGADSGAKAMAGDKQKAADDKIPF
jgi:hypothetical protein